MFCGTLKYSPINSIKFHKTYIHESLCMYVHMSCLYKFHTCAYVLFCTCVQMDICTCMKHTWHTCETCTCTRHMYAPLSSVDTLPLVPVWLVSPSDAAYSHTRHHRRSRTSSVPWSSLLYCTRWSKAKWGNFENRETSWIGSLTTTTVISDYKMLREDRLTLEDLALYNNTHNIKL